MRWAILGIGWGRVLADSNRGSVLIFATCCRRTPRSTREKKLKRKKKEKKVPKWLTTNARVLQPSYHLSSLACICPASPPPQRISWGPGIRGGGGKDARLHFLSDQWTKKIKQVSRLSLGKNGLTVTVITRFLVRTGNKVPSRYSFVQ